MPSFGKRMMEKQIHRPSCEEDVSDLSHEEIESNSSETIDVSSNDDYGEIVDEISYETLLHVPVRSEELEVFSSESILHEDSETNNDEIIDEFSDEIVLPVRSEGLATHSTESSLMENSVANNHEVLGGFLKETFQPVNSEECIKTELPDESHDILITSAAKDNEMSVTVHMLSRGGPVMILEKRNNNATASPATENIDRSVKIKEELKEVIKEEPTDVHFVIDDVKADGQSCETIKQTRHPPKRKKKSGEQKNKTKVSETGKSPKTAKQWKVELKGKTDNKSEITCDMCSKQFSQKSDLRVHMRIHNNEKPYICDKCGATFTTQHHLTGHMRTHTGAKPYMCKVCNKEFSASHNLRRHEKIHTGDKPYKCDLCDQAFRASHNLQRHTRTHMKDKPIKCDICGKGFSEGNALRRHMSNHNNDLEFECGICGKKFNRGDNLKTHMRIHSEEKEFECDVCGQKFNFNQNLKKHMNIHLDEKEFLCDFCGKGFSERQRLKKHLKIHDN